MQRQQGLGRLPDAFLSPQPLSAYEAQRYLDSLDAFADGFSPVDEQLYARFRGQAPGPGVSRFRKVVPFAFRNGRDFVSAQHEEYAFQVNPLAYLSYGRARQSERDDREASVPIWQNTRGARASGHIGKHIFFETRLEENQRRDVWPAFQAADDTAPRLGNTKFDDDTYDYWFVTGVVGFRSKYFEGGRSSGSSKPTSATNGYPTSTWTWRSGPSPSTMPRRAWIATWRLS
ncbi:MAG: hypothetical protein IH820_16820 [Bacteroidetes bacterium]|nr:hypothetical protein [Bacteroidota bacterium]